MIYKLSILTAVSVLFLGLVGISTVMADTPPNPLQQACDEISSASPACQQSETQGTTDPVSGPNGVINLTVSLFSLAAGIAAVVWIIIGGFFIITAGGDPQKVAVGKTRVLSGLIGLAIVALAWAVVYLVIGKIIGT